MASEKHHGIIFSTVDGFRPLALDLYLPTDPQAVCVYVHGGGWRRGSRRDGPGYLTGPGEEYLERMADAGVAVAACDYRLSGEATFPAQLDDVIAACRFVTSDLAPFEVSDVPLMLWGYSAGAHLAALVALDKAIGDRVAAVSCWSAPSDIVRHQDDLDAIGAPGNRSPGSSEAKLLGGAVDEIPDLAQQASPINYVRPSATRFQLVHGTEDRAVPISQSDRFALALDAAGNSVSLVRVEGADHFFQTIERSRLTGLIDQTVSFFVSTGSKSLIVS